VNRRTKQVSDVALGDAVEWVRRQIHG
jgi:hypothetical protein